MQVLWWIVEVLEAGQVEVREMGESSHLCRELQDLGIITEIERVQRGEGANAEWHVAEVILGQVEGTDGWSYHIVRQVLELVVGDVKNSEARRPLSHVRDFRELVA